MSAGTQSILFSVCALVFSVFSLALAQVQRTLDNRRIVRQQLTDTLSRITDMAVQGAKNPDDMQFLGPAATSQARLATMLIEQLPPKLVSDVDYVTLASVAFDPIEGKQNYEKAIRAARSPYYRRLARRGYASFLFNYGDYQAARTQFSTALGELTDSTDESHALRYDLYKLWSWYEQRAGHQQEAQETAQLADAELANIENQAWRDWYSREQPSPNSLEIPTGSGTLAQDTSQASEAAR